ncbi:MAG: murein biosynthesis integral membrane protein MurJ [Candidatus Pacebacteria bacterium]|nr:murein biosynthesis integral membrane protein MurJ [Candidatus Paceibacterota bacterium]
MIKKFINRESASITSAAFIIGIMTLAAKFLGVLKNSILAHNFPANDIDIYLAAFRIPDFIFNIIVLGALSAGFIPVFSKLVSQNKKEEAFKAANNILNILFIVLLGITMISMVLAPWIIDLIVPGFDAEKKQKTVELTRIMFLSPIFMLLSSITGGILQSYKRFLIYSLSPIVYNLGIIFGAMVLAKEYGLAGLAWGVPLGAFLQFIIQFPSVKMLGFRYKMFVNTKSAEVRTIIKIMVPRIFTMIISQVNPFVVTIIASTLAAGSITAFTYANDLQSFPLGIFAISFAVACFPTLSELSGKYHRGKFTEVLLSTTKQILYFIIPLSIFLIVFRAQAVRVIYGHGYFDWTSTVATIDALYIFCISLFAQSLIPLFSRAFWALHDSKTPFYAALFSAIINIILALWLSPKFGLNGLVGAFTLSSILNAAILFILLNKKYLSTVPSNFYIAIGQISFSAIIAGLIGYKTLYAVEPYLDTHTFLGIGIQGALSGTAMLVVYCAWGWIFQIEEFIKFKNAFRKKIFKTKLKTTELIAEE